MQSESAVELVWRHGASEYGQKHMFCRHMTDPPLRHPSPAGNMHSETVGSRGPVLLEDYHLLEKLGSFHRYGIFDPLPYGVLSAVTCLLAVSLHSTTPGVHSKVSTLFCMTLDRYHSLSAMPVAVTQCFVTPPGAPLLSTVTATTLNPQPAFMLGCQHVILPGPIISNLSGLVFGWLHGAHPGARSARAGHGRQGLLRGHARRDGPHLRRLPERGGWLESQHSLVCSSTVHKVIMAPSGDALVPLPSINISRRLSVIWALTDNCLCAALFLPRWASART